MAGDPVVSRLLRHGAGLVLAGLLGSACYGIYLYLPRLVRGTIVQDLTNLLTFLAIIAVLTLADLLWGMIDRRLGQHDH